MKKTAIPEEIIKAAEERECPEGTLTKLCRYKGEDVYSYVYSEEMTIGMPELYLWDGKRARTVEGMQALALLNKLPI